MGAEVELFPQDQVTRMLSQTGLCVFILSTVFIPFTIITIFCYQLIKKLKDIKI